MANAPTFRRMAILAFCLLVATICLVLLADVGAQKSCLSLQFATIGCFLRDYKEILSGLLALDGAIFAACLAWAAVQQQIQSSERDRNLQKLEIKKDRRIAMQSEITELQAMLKWGESTFTRLDKTPYGPGVLW